MTKHFLFVMFEGGGTVPPELGLARRMQERGHRVTVLGDDCLRDEIEAEGVRFVGYEHAPNRTSKAPDDDPIRDWDFENPMDGFHASLTKAVCGTALGVARDVVACHERDPIDVVAGCGLRLGFIIGAEKARLPSVVLMPNVDVRPARGRPGFGPGFHPMGGPDGMARDEELWAAIREVFLAGQPALDEAREALGLPKTRHPWDEYERAERVLLLTSRHFDYPYELPERTVFAGPVLDDPSWAHERTTASSADPLILVTLGSTFQNQLDAYRRVVSAMRGRAFHGVVTLGNVFAPLELEAPDNVEVLAAAPHGPLLQRAAAVVTHGGHGSVMKSLAAGVPMVVLPLGRDQAENGARVEWHGAGLKVSPSAEPDEIAAALTRVVVDERFAQNARELGAAIRAEIGEDIAVRELETVADFVSA